MMKHFFILAILAMTASSFTSHTTGDGNFTLVMNEKGISLYEKWVDIGNNRKARELKAVFTITCTQTAALALLQDESKGTSWNANASSFAIKDNVGSGWVNYIEYDLPWPMDNQDCVLKHNKTTGTNSIEVTFASTEHTAFPQKKNTNRIPDIKGKWVFASDGSNQKVEYFITTSPSATLPRSITDPVVRNNLVKSMSSFKTLLEKK